MQSTSRCVWRRMLELAGLILLAVSMVNCSFLWFETGPDLDDPCTMRVHGIPPSETREFHVNPVCDHGGVFWGRTTGRMRLHFGYPDQRSFNVCLTAGEFESVYVWHDYVGQYWTPVAVPNYLEATQAEASCRQSINGTMDLYLEPPWAGINYYAHLSWEVTLTPDKEDIVHIANPYKHPEDKDDDVTEDEDAWF